MLSRRPCKYKPHHATVLLYYTNRVDSPDVKLLLRLLWPMRVFLLATIAVILLRSLTLPGFVIQAPVADPVDVRLCALLGDPAAWIAKRVRVSGLVMRDFEHFTLSDDCAAEKPTAELWLTYGGRLPSGTIYCCPGEGDTAERAEPLTIAGIPLPLVRDATFEQFRKALQSKRPAHAVIVGTFFAEQGHNVSETGWGGFGHMGCCALLAIERVERFALR